MTESVTTLPAGGRPASTERSAEPSPGAWRRLLTGLRIHGPLWTVEVVVLNASFVLAFIVRYGGRVPGTYSGSRALLAALLLTVGYSVASIAFKAYRSVWRYVTVHDMMTLAMTVATATAVVAAVEVTLLTDNHPIPLSALIIGAALGYIALTHLKLSSRLQHERRRHDPRSPLLVIGAGSAGVALVRQLRDEPGSLTPVAYIDDDHRKIGRSINGLPVVGSRRSLAGAVARHRIDTVAIAIPSAPPEVISELSQAASGLGVRTLIVPSLEERLGRRPRLTLRPAGIEDLFGRPEVTVDGELIRATLSGKRILVTGAAGSIGSEIARQVARLSPEALVLVDNNESGLTDLRDELIGDITADLRVVSITDRAAVETTVAETRPQVVVHAAALKHVDIVERQPHEAARVNVLGTAICIDAAEAAGAERFVLISTDKAVDPVNVLGASKRIGERLIASRHGSDTIMLAVRFGNVLRSRGSVVPRFERQIDEGGPVTLTHPDVHRYFMSIPEAVTLVLQSAGLARPGRIYVLDMGEQVSIRDLATRLASLRGLRIPEDIEIVYTGLRPGERLREELIHDDEQAADTDHPRITELTEPAPPTPAHWHGMLGDLEALLRTADGATIREQLLSLALHHPAPSAEGGGDQPLPLRPVWQTG